MLSLLCRLYTDDEDRLRLKTATIPLIIENTFFLGIHMGRLQFWKRHMSNHTSILLPFVKILDLFSSLFISFHQFNLTKHDHLSLISRNPNFTDHKLIALYSKKIN
jgi:hypothetical protein